MSAEILARTAAAMSLATALIEYAATTRDRHRRPTDHGESNIAHSDLDRMQGPVDR
ncbi:hypothetical protein ACFFV7_35820 [Nonomuraea spiralis]|uniref:Uncharacterized protein n=1 Tax=Nonomuraea spiralis TaxID=46182 RepID=A0ABV5IQ26_9ACTN|nr:hypothetical protein [Nonomuraea spiralis]GGT11229.1 hypothetical protein GCM10010176_064760 [Nonomuraea spiralis]